MNWIIILVIIILAVLIVLFHDAANEFHDERDGINDAIKRDKERWK